MRWGGDDDGGGGGGGALDRRRSLSRATNTRVLYDTQFAYANHSLFYANGRFSPEIPWLMVVSSWRSHDGRERYFV